MFRGLFYRSKVSNVSSTALLQRWYVSELKKHKKFPEFDKKPSYYEDDKLDHIPDSTAQRKRAESILDPAKYPANTSTFPKTHRNIKNNNNNNNTVGCQTLNSDLFSHIKPENLVYIPKYSHQLDGSLLLKNNENDENVEQTQNDRITLYEYGDKVNKNEYISNIKQTIVFSIMGIMTPLFIYISMYYGLPWWRMSDLGATTVAKFGSITKTTISVLILYGIFSVGKHIKQRVKIKKEPFISKMVLISKKLAENKYQFMLECDIKPESLKKAKKMLIPLNSDINNLPNTMLYNNNMDISDYYNLNRYIELLPSISDDGKQYTKCVLNMPMGEPKEIKLENGQIEHKYNVSQIEIPLNGMIKNWELFITFMRNIPNPSGKFKPVKIQYDGYIPVMSYKQLMFGNENSSNVNEKKDNNSNNKVSRMSDNLSIDDKRKYQARCKLNIYTHGVPPYKPKNSILFLSNFNKTKLFVIHDTCSIGNKPLISESTYYEAENQSFLHCKGCYSKTAKQLKPLHSTIDWKIELPPNFEETNKEIYDEYINLLNNSDNSDNNNDENITRVENILKEYGIVMIKLDGGCIKNKLPETNTYGECSLDRFLSFYCCNQFRLTHPKKPQNIDDVYVLGEFFTELPQFDTEGMQQLR